MVRGKKGIAWDPFRKDYLKALLAGDRVAAGEVIENLLARSIDLPAIYLNVLSPVMVQIGDLWGRGAINVAQEKLATQITLGQMAKLRLLQVGPRPSAQRVLVSCVEGEEHYVGARMAADLFMMEGWSVDFLGPNVPGTSLIEMIEIRQPRLVALSATMQRHVPKAKRLMRQLAALSVPPKVLLGGQALRNGESLAPNRLTCRVAGNVVEGLIMARELLNSERRTTVLDAYLIEFGRQVRELRAQAGWTQQRLAELTGLTRAYIVLVEGGKQNVTMDVVIRLANALGVLPERLLPQDQAGTTPRERVS
ncbi:MAG TPA: cobalamin-dependent protein [Candidatus Binatia bacterium]|nr:cobalamin-dependent protein [Candidatus Binatia bacterium]